MKKIGHVAAREFLATVATRGFIISMLIMPTILIVMAVAAPRLFNQRNFRAEGQIAIVDPTGVVGPELGTAVEPQAIAARRAEDARRTLAAAPAGVRQLAGAGTESSRAIDTVLGQIPNLTVVERPPNADIAQEKEWLKQEEANERRHLALVLIHPDAVVPANGSSAYGGYDLWVPANLDDRIEAAIYQSLREAIVTARARARNLDRDTMTALMRVDRAQSVTVTRDNERRTVGGFNQILPFAFGFLLFFSVLMGGQTLMTTTIEEKSSRVVEVLLSAVSPLELMAGKILGQMCVSLVALGLYAAIGLVSLASFALFGLLDPWLLFYLVVFFVLTYLTLG